ncbi:MAG: thioredoxin family protein [Candidatus Nanopelagicales bacterium]|jgi:thiol-disulfide isomerase/thioredoxin|nr:thioredoxin family protein [Candidatus Nanopelagicales bacterium]
MPAHPLAAAGPLALALALTLAGCSSEGTAADAGAAGAATSTAASPSPSTEATPADTAEPSDAATEAQPGAWVDLAAYEADPATFHDAGDVVLFFNADWCPTCRTTVQNLDAQGVPSGLTVVSVDFDDSTDLRQRHGVTVQHTFVQVDPEGAAVTKFTGSLTGADIAAATA